MQDLIRALETSYSGITDDATRRQCQDYLMNTDGLMPHLIEIINNHNDSALRLAAAIKLKNMILSRWSVSEYRKKTAEGLDKQELTGAEKQLFCVNSYEMLLKVVGVKALRKLIVLAMRHVIDEDFATGEYISILCGHVEKSLQMTNDLSHVLTALEPLRIIFDLNRDSAIDITEKVLVKFYPALLALASQLASTPFFQTNEASAVVRKLVKVFSAIMKMHIPTVADARDVLLNNYINTLDFYVAVMTQPIPNLETMDEENLSELQAMKAIKNVTESLSRSHFGKHCSKSFYSSSEGDKRKELFLTSGVCERIMGAFSHILERYSRYSELVSVHILSCYCAALEQSATYALLKPSMHVLITELCQKWMAYNAEDVEKWEEDPIEVAKNDNDDFGTVDRCDAAIRFIVAICRFRGKDWLEFILTHITNMLEAATSTPTSVRMKTVSSAEGVDANKDGALCMLGCIAPRLKHRKLPLDAVFLTHVAPECESSNPFLRKRASWVVREFLDGETGTDDLCVSEDTLIALYNGVHKLMQDSEIPVRSQAAMAVRVFFGLCHDETKFFRLKHEVETSFHSVVQALFTLTNEEGLLDNDRIVQSITELVGNFKEAALPYVAEIMAQLVQKLDKYMEDGEEEEVMYGSKWQTAMQSVETITTILDSMERSKNYQVFTQVEPVLNPLIYKMIGPFGDIELVEDGLALLSNLTYSIPKLNDTLWALFTLLYTSLVGGASPVGMNFSDAVLTDDGSLMEWGSIVFRSIVSVMDNYICSDTQTFVTGSVQFQDGSTLTYLDMIFNIARCYLVPEDSDYEFKALHTLELLSLCFEGFVQLDKNDIVTQQRVRAFGVEVLRLSWQFIEQVKTVEFQMSKKLSTHLACMNRLWSVMLLWNSATFLEMIQEVGIAKDVLDVLYASGRQPGDKVIFNNGLEGPRTVCLGSCTAIHQLQSLPALAPYTRGVVETLVNSFRAQIVHIQGILANDDEVWGESFDSEQELDENEDAHISNTDLLLQKLQMQFEEDALNDDDSFEPSTEMCTRKSPVTEMNEFMILEETITKAESVIVSVLGPDGFNQFKEEVKQGYLVHEEYRRREAEMY